MQGVVGGHRGCTGLSGRGREQAEALRDRLVATGFQADAIATSLLPRAIETAEILAGGLGFPTSDIISQCDLCELHAGEGDGLSWEVFDAQYGSWDPMDHPDKPRSPGGESMYELVERVGPAVEALVDDHAGGTVLVPCHGGVITGVTVALLGMPLRWIADLRNTSVTELVKHNGTWRLCRVNDAAHLELNGLATA